MMTDKKTKCVALFSGGLDSSLAVLMMLEQGIEVTALMFINDFSTDDEGRLPSSRKPDKPAERYEFKAEILHLGREFIEIVKKPKYGYGKNMNPCIDCNQVAISGHALSDRQTGGSRGDTVASPDRKTYEAHDCRARGVG
jgi:tRNA U34 2-thiouridine synthase MnmA/TrmU